MQTVNERIARTGESLGFGLDCSVSVFRLAEYPVVNPLEGTLGQLRFWLAFIARQHELLSLYWDNLL